MSASRERIPAGTQRPLDAERRAHLRRWVARLEEGPPAAQAAARGMTVLLDEVERLDDGRSGVGLDPSRRLELRALSERLWQGPEGAQSAARGLELLLAEVERLEERDHGSDEADDAEDPERERRRFERERRRGTNGGPPTRARAIAPPKLRRPTLPEITLPRPRPWVLALAGGVVLLALAFVVVARVTAPDLSAEGPTARVLGAEAAKTLAFAVAGSPNAIEKARWSVDGRDVSDRARTAGGRSALVGYALQDGEHTVEVSVPGMLPGMGASRTWNVEIDRTPPTLRVDRKALRATPGRPAAIAGEVDDAVRVTAVGQESPVEDGRFRLELAAAPTTRFSLVALDEAGNRAEMPLRFTLVPREPRSPIRSVHLTFYAWKNPDLRNQVMQMIDEGKINSVELDLKDESGIVGFKADIPFAKKIGAMQAVYDLPKAIELLHSKGVYVIGRIVAFRDPIHAPAAWKRGWRDQVIQTPGGRPYAGYGGFTNFADPTVRQYNIDIARRAAEAGIDDVLYDYVRRPDGPISSMRFPKLRGTPEKSIASFLADARRHLAPYDTFLGASVFGVAASRPEEVAQHIPSMGRQVDYIAPMVYPSHWGPGEYGVANPNAQPYDIVRASIVDFQKAVKGTGARVVAWLQDFSYGVTYGPQEVRAQIDAAAAVGVDEWILWNAESIYTADALDPHDPEPPLETVRHEPKPPLPAVPGTR